MRCGTCSVASRAPSASKHGRTVAEPSRATLVGSCDTSPPKPYRPDPVTAEADRIDALLAYAVVYKDWQDRTFSPPGARGYNIAGVLVDPDNRVVCWARNNVIRNVNGTQHGEVRLITNYLHNDEKRRNLRGFKLYTTLEPCAMCSGMMTLQSLPTSIYGQTDPGFGGALERLQLNSRRLPNGWCPYPRGVQSVASDLDVRRRLDQAFADWSGGASLTAFLASEEARALYAEAWDQLHHFQPAHAANKEVLAAALAFLEGVPETAVVLPYTVNCTGGE